jgi:hypothetical protein
MSSTAAAILLCLVGTADDASAGRLYGGTIMKVLKTLLWTALGVATLGVMGCDVFMGGRAREEPVIVEERRPVIVEERRPVIVEQRPVYVEPPRREVIIEQAPPPLIDVHVH